MANQPPQNNHRRCCHMLGETHQTATRNLIPESAHIRLHRLKVRITKAYKNDKTLVPAKLWSLFDTPSHHAPNSKYYNSRNGSTRYELLNAHIPLPPLHNKSTLHTHFDAIKSRKHTPIYSSHHSVYNYAHPQKNKNNNSMSTKQLLSTLILLAIPIHPNPHYVTDVIPLPLPPILYHYHYIQPYICSP